MNAAQKAEARIQEYKEQIKEQKKLYKELTENHETLSATYESTVRELGNMQRKCKDYDALLERNSELSQELDSINNNTERINTKNPVSVYNHIMRVLDLSPIIVQAEVSKQIFATVHDRISNVVRKQKNDLAFNEKQLRKLNDIANDALSERIAFNPEH